MSSPVVPNDVKALIPSASGSFCGKFLNVFKLPSLVYQLVAYIWNEDGTFTEGFKNDICALNCKTGDSTGFPTPLVLASDGQFADRIQINWSIIAGATSYDLYRGTVNDSSTAVLLAGDLTVNTYEDLAITPNNLFYYWVKAKNASAMSGLGQGDSGYAGMLTTSLPAIAELLASHGMSATPGNAIVLEWEKIAGADSYDIYRSESNNFNTAGAPVEQNVKPVALNPMDVSTFNNCYDNGDDIAYAHYPGAANGYKTYYFWVVAKRSMAAPPAQSLPSNGGIGVDGWVCGDGSGVIPAGGSGGNLFSGFPNLVQNVYQGGYSRIWFSLTGCGASGAGGGTVRGGGGGGAPAIIVGSYVLPTPSATVSKFRVVTTPENDAAGGAGETDGVNGGVTTFEYSAAGDFSDTIVIATCNAPAKGEYEAASNGPGGNGAGGSVDAAVTNGVIYTGYDAEDANGSDGGHSGHTFGAPRIPQAHFNGNFNPVTGFTGFGVFAGEPGSGSKANPSGASTAVGGTGRRGIANFVGY